MVIEHLLNTELHLFSRGIVVHNFMDISYSNNKLRLCITVVVLHLFFVYAKISLAAPLGIMDFVPSPPKASIKVYPKETDPIPLEEDILAEQGWLHMRGGNRGILFCSARKGQEIVECKNSKSGRFSSDIYRIALSGWQLKQVVPDERSGVWYFFFQQ